MAPAQTLVTVCKPGDTVPFVCGTLYPVLSNGDLAAYIEKSNETAPEIDGTWDVEEVQVQNSKTFLQYTNYTGPERKNMPDTTPDDNGWNVWNVGLVWSRQCRKALELAEVFSLSRSIFVGHDK
ncbi:hypothetical protein M7I_6513 [Glarea lozoyensis 74030]|uniref:Uncharacterized protein n=1 Tax=Glarea lozoyensis (strain ATCC 74030 / MF5533) TaxID=1104152 RepID=H0EUS4_GLAL7|nr:hypothetical protein M7I_6513 [Glarea lozoyensis 74030]